MKKIVKTVMIIVVVLFVSMCVVYLTPPHKTAYKNCKKYDTIINMPGPAGVAQRDAWSEELTEFESQEILQRVVALDYKWFLGRD